MKKENICILGQIFKSYLQPQSNEQKQLSLLPPFQMSIYYLILVNTFCWFKTYTSHIVSNTVYFSSWSLWDSWQRFFLEFADLLVVSKSSVSRSIWRWIAAINERMNNIRFPITYQEQRQIQNGFYRLAEFPGVIGNFNCSYLNFCISTIDLQLLFLLLSFIENKRIK